MKINWRLSCFLGGALIGGGLILCDKGARDYGAEKERDKFRNMVKELGIVIIEDENGHKIVCKYE